MTKLEKEKLQPDTEEYNRKLNKHMILFALQQIDPSVSMKDIESMHVSDFIYLGDKILTEGREIVDEGDDGNFREKK